MRMVKQTQIADGAVAMDCGVCVIAMLTNLPYERILADMPEYRKTTDHEWMRYPVCFAWDIQNPLLLHRHSQRAFGYKPC
jgi:hypothetical protein